MDNTVTFKIFDLSEYIASHKIANKSVINKMEKIIRGSNKAE